MSRRRMAGAAQAVDLAAAFDALYAELPEIECRGKCWDSCGRITMTRVEHQRVAAAGYDIEDGLQAPTPAVCPALTILKRCDVYAVRPLVCRLWGLTEDMPCSFGCVPEGGHLTVPEGYEFLARAYELSGEHAQAARLREPFTTPERAEAFRRRRLAMVEADRLAYEAHVRRAEGRGTALYVHGRGQFGRRPLGEGTS